MPRTLWWSENIWKQCTILITLYWMVFQPCMLRLFKQWAAKPCTSFLESIIIGFPDLFLLKVLRLLSLESSGLPLSFYWVPQEICIWTYDSFDNNLAIKNNYPNIWRRVVSRLCWWTILSPSNMFHHRTMLLPMRWHNSCLAAFGHFEH